MTRKQMNEYVERVRRIKTLTDKLLEMYDGLGSIAKASLAKLLPDLADAIDQYRNQ